MSCPESCRLLVENLSVVREGETILHHVSFCAKGGEITALIGRNGAGKTTLLKALLGRIPHGGTVSYFGTDGAHISKPVIGYVPQMLSVDPYTPITVCDLLCANMSWVPVWLFHKKAIRLEALALLNRVGGESLLDKPLRNLSGGELQRVLLAFALRPAPDLLLLDEPVSAVDTVGIETFYETVTGLKETLGRPILLVSHNLSHVKRYTSSAVLLDRTVLEVGPTPQVMKSQAFSEAFGLL